MELSHGRNKKYIILLINLLIISFLFGCNLNQKDKTTKNESSINPQNDKLIISKLSKNHKSDLIEYDIANKKETAFVKDRNVEITGDISKSERKVAYADALGDSDPWRIYLYDLDKKKTYQVTNDNYGKVNPRFIENNLIYFQTISKKASGGVFKVGYINIDTKKYTLIDEENSDRDVDCFDIKDNKIIMSTSLESESESSWNKNDGQLVPITHTILESDLEGNALREVSKFKASSITSISYNFDKTKVIVCGQDINGTEGKSIFEINLSDGKASALITEKPLSNSLVKDLGDIAQYSKDNTEIYFTGIAKDSKEMTIDDIHTSPTAIYSYDINAHNIKEIYKPELDCKISSIYVK